MEDMDCTPSTSSAPYGDLMSENGDFSKTGDWSRKFANMQTPLTSLFPRSQRKRKHLCHRLRHREYAQGTRELPSVFHTTRQLCTYITPNATVVNIQKPNAFPRKFSPDGRYLLAVSASQTALVVYWYRGVNVAGQLLNTPSPCSLVSTTEVGSEEIRANLFDCLFSQRHTIELLSQQAHSMHLNREFSLFTADSKHVIVAASTRITNRPRPVDQFPVLFDVHQNNESLSPDPDVNHHILPLENIMLCCVDVEKGVLCDSQYYNCDKILLTNACGVQLFDRKLMVFSLQHQRIHLYHIEESDGRFSHVRTIGRWLHDDDEMVLTHAPGIRCNSSQLMAMAETAVCSLKHRLLAFLYRQAAKSSSDMAIYFQQFDQLHALKIARCQLVTDTVLLLRYTHESAIGHRDNGQVASLLVFYDWNTTEILSVYDQYSRELCDVYEKHADLFRHPDGDHLAYACDINSCVHSTRSHEQFKQSIRATRGHASPEVIRRVLLNLPVTCTQFSPSPYIDQRLFSYNDKVVGPYDRPKHAADATVRFHHRDSGRVAFSMHCGVSRGPATFTGDVSVNQPTLIAYIWHPFDPLCITMQRNRTAQYTLNIHLPANSDMVIAESPAHQSRWVTLYPTYINAKRTVAEGRRVPKEKGVDLPTSQEINDIVKNAGLNCELEKTKMYPRDPNRDMNFQGRVRVQLKNEDGSLCDEKFPTRLSLMLYCADMIPKLKSRLQKAGGSGETVAAPAAATGKKNKKKK